MKRTDKVKEAFAVLADWPVCDMCLCRYERWHEPGDDALIIDSDTTCSLCDLKAFTECQKFHLSEINNPDHWTSVGVKTIKQRIRRRKGLPTRELST